MPEQEILAVLFDWDYTLARAAGEMSSSQRITALFNGQGLDHSANEVQAALQERRMRVQNGKLRGQVEPQTRRDIMIFYRQVLSLLGHRNVSWEFANRLYSAFGRLPAVMYPASLPTLYSLNQEEVQLGIISNNSASARPKIEQHVQSFIHPKHIVISEEIGVHKPAKTIFLRAASRLNIPPSRCLYVGDNLQVDAIGSVQQGGYAFGLWIDRKDTGGDQPMPSCTARITSLNQVIDFIYSQKGC